MSDLTSNKISQAEVDAVNVKSVPGSRLHGTIQENKNVFDRLAELIVSKFNGALDVLSTEGAGNISFEAVEGLVASTVQDAIAEVYTLLTTETNEREEEDDSLWSAVDDAVDVENAIRQGLEAEIAARAAGDASLSAEVSEKAPISHASTERTYGAADTQRYGHMRFATDAEIEGGAQTEKAVTPAQLGTKLDAEASARMSADAALRMNVEAETQARKAADAAEASARATADGAIEGDVSAVRADIEAVLTLLGPRRAWQDVLNGYSTWAGVKTNGGSWLKTQMKSL
jgi:hypothetical protein